MDYFVLFKCHKGKVSQVNQESHEFPPEYELDLGCRETHRMEDHTRSDPYRVGRSKLKLLLESLGAEVIYVGRCGTHHKFDVVGSNGLDNTGSRIVDDEGGSIQPTSRMRRAKISIVRRTEHNFVLCSLRMWLRAVGTVLLGP